MRDRLLEAGGELAAFDREVAFHPSRRWRFDFAWIGRRVALEVEGGTYIRGGHSHPAGIENDCIKGAEAAILGWCVIRATGHMVRDGRALELVRRALEARA